MQTIPFSNEADEIARAEQRVAERKAELSKSLRRVGHSSEAFARRLSGELKPALWVGVAVAGAAGATALAVALVRRSRRRSRWLAPQEPSALAVAAKTAGLWALRLLARRVAQEIVSVATAPNQVERRSAVVAENGGQRPGPLQP